MNLLHFEGHGIDFFFFLKTEPKKKDSIDLAIFDVSQLNGSYFSILCGNPVFVALARERAHGSLGGDLFLNVPLSPSPLPTYLQTYSVFVALTNIHHSVVVCF